MSELLFPLVYRAFSVEGTLEFYIVDSRGKPVASTKNEAEAVIFVEIANQHRCLPEMPNIEMDNNQDDIVL